MLYFVVNTTNVRPASGFEFDMPALECHICIVWIEYRQHQLDLFAHADDKAVYPGRTNNRMLAPELDEFGTTSAAPSAAQSSTDETFAVRCQFHQYFTSSFSAHRSQKHKKDWLLDCIFVLLGSVRTKAACKILVKSTPSVNFNNILQVSFLYKRVFLKTVWLCDFLTKEYQCKSCWWNLL